MFDDLAFNVSDDVEVLKGLVAELHASHSSDGESLSCSDCVFAVLNRVELESKKVVKRRIFEGDF